MISRISVRMCTRLDRYASVSGVLGRSIGNEVGRRPPCVWVTTPIMVYLAQSLCNLLLADCRVDQQVDKFFRGVPDRVECAKDFVELLDVWYRIMEGRQCLGLAQGRLIF